MITEKEWLDLQAVSPKRSNVEMEGSYPIAPSEMKANAEEATQLAH